MEQHTLATYNTQGSKWSEVGALARDNDIVAVQESGGPPWPPQHPQQPVAQRQDGNFQASEYRWGDRWLYYLPVPNAGNNRTGMAVVTRHRAADFAVLANNAGAGVRGSVGVRFGDTWYYTIHANPGSARDDSLEARRSRNETARSDADGFLRRVDRRARQSGHEWVVMGDFNIDLQRPDALPGGDYVPAVGHRYNPGVPTHQHGGELDFMVASREVHGYGARVPRGRGADHYEVEFRPNLRASGDYDRRPYSLHNPDEDLNVDVWGADRGGVGLNDAYRNRSNVHQNFGVMDVPWAPGSVMFRSRYEHDRCLGLGRNPVGPGSGVQPIVTERCDAHDPEQHFTARAGHSGEWLTYDGRHVTATGKKPLAKLIAAPRTSVTLRLK